MGQAQRGSLATNLGSGAGVFAPQYCSRSSEFIVVRGVGSGIGVLGIGVVVAIVTRPAECPRCGGGEEQGIEEAGNSLTVNVIRPAGVGAMSVRRRRRRPGKRARAWPWWSSDAR